jgi:osmotically-inducible protein OsmY
MAHREGLEMDDRQDNERLQAEVRRELSRHPSIDADAIGIKADHGLILLSGRVLGCTQRRCVEDATLRVAGIRAVVDEMKVGPGHRELQDAELACMVADTLARLNGPPGARVGVVVHEGKVRLAGTAVGAGQKALAVAAAERAVGCCGCIEDAITVEPAVATDLRPSPAHGVQEPHAALGDSPGVERRPATASNDSVAESLSGGFHTCTAHHRSFPEVRGEGETGVESVAHLIHQLGRAVEHVDGGWQRQAIGHAIDEAKARHEDLSRKSGETPAGLLSAGPAIH